ncbi:MAG: Protease HtpX-like protein [Candidatus Uhrbacteria bacterium GW2011_GWF2_41_16]|jgi:heat shock protein HtpX|uniref:Protease HtpX homolog n=2 Tax=Candidatus Uhriibacteriota TaxID=1752732 RepID=A0A0G0VFV7_9BACT|nr:MAG: Protease HtpX-like protein [Candidatus Uhrbacteria bacterium GW2011_GWA2_41_10]KKR87556.1 MAG: Protease HtpX-like protein [Candidatus Uhrbacteria bacterium GW2011_GWC2_41_11]KKR98536.1 MAG: Protease HtpX-like protein [Candidatus Uhrbacteria bacterium GW2011_GWF2_41_16]HBO99927.1 zinc metalloprotease HtpX [Candidatus Uhrbacteria bacterium]
MYSEIAANKRHTVILIGLFSVLIVLIGFAFGAQVDYPIEGMIIALFVSVVMTLIGYYKGDAVALAVSGAQPIEQRDNPVLYRTVENLAIAGGLATPKIYVMSDPSPNAFATGRDPAHASLAVTTGLLEIMEPTELEGVIAHELSHVKNYDVRLMTIVVVLVGVVVLFSDWFLRMTFFRRRDSEEGSNQFTLILFIVGLALAVLSPLFAELIKLAVSRRREYLADASGALLTRYPDGLANALEKIATYDRPLAHANHATAHLFLANPFDPHVTKKFEQFFSTHPPIEERIARLRNMGR